MLVHALFPVPGGFLATPARPVRLERLLSRFPERRDFNLTLLGQRVTPGPRLLAVPRAGVEPALQPIDLTGN